MHITQENDNSPVDGIVYQLFSPVFILTDTWYKHDYIERRKKKLDSTDGVIFGKDIYVLLLLAGSTAFAEGHIVGSK